ncbi:MAG: hypothetical protein B7Y81_12875 [Caulobacter sp. 32-67-35]|nr:MAG: hypothetical protein B7Y81_12875 [Caulobacter sp. 32-67-35]HQR91091.1 hypothetical protein [Caulobacter sp.]
MAKVLRPALIVLVLALAHAPLAAARGLPLRDQVSGVATLGVSVGDNERSWVDRGLGKAGSGETVTAGAIIAWRPALGGRIGGLVTADLQSALSPSIGLDEAYFTLRPSPGAAVRLSGRAGLFFPPVSLEHDGSEWSLSRSITPSAINSWVAEEVKTAGLELTARTTVTGRPMGLTLAAFQGNDTSGTLLAFRGWALHDLRATWNDTLPLPPVPTMFAGKQATRTRPVDEVDGRWGVYGRLDVKPIDTLDLSLLAYDNNGDRTTVVDGQYAWRTRFLQAGARWSPAARTEVLFQIMQGETSMGPRIQGLTVADVGFQSAFILMSRDIGAGAITTRLEQFSIDDRSFKDSDNNAEHGWAATLAWTRPLRQTLDLVIEGVFVTSDRPDRARLGEDRRQDNLRLTTALRASF